MPKRAQTKPKFADAAATCYASQNKYYAAFFEKVMADAVLMAQKDGTTDPEQIKAAMLEACALEKSRP